MSKPRVRTLPLLTVLAFAVTAIPRLADACSAPESGLTASIPAGGATYPANAALVFEGHGISLAAVTVTIDGAPAALVEADLPGLGLVAQIEPEPAAGQAVVVSGNFCAFEECEPHTLSFTAGPADTSAPNATDVTFAAFDHAAFVSSGGDCMSDSDLTFYVHTDVSPQAAGQAPIRYRMSFAPALADLEVGGLFAAQGPSTRAISVTDDLLADAAITDLCLQLDVIDLAGNAATPIEVCKPCFFRHSDANQASETPAEPVWTDADLVPGSVCAGAVGTDSDTGGSESSGTSDDPPTTGTPTGTGEAGETTVDSEVDSDTSGGEQDGSKDGCACRSDAAPAGPLALLAGLLLIGSRRRR
jgi:MYXO-CTERM domain-containing protein